MSNEKLIQQIQESLLLHLNATVGTDVDRIDAAFHMANNLMAAADALRHDEAEIERMLRCIDSLNMQLALTRSGIT
jgi:hypothetical protein